MADGAKFAVQGYAFQKHVLINAASLTPAGAFDVKVHTEQVGDRAVPRFAKGALPRM